MSLQTRNSTSTADVQSFVDDTQEVTGMSTSFRPGLHRLSLPRNVHDPSNKNTTKSIGHATAMDLAIAAIQPEGLPLTLIPLYKIIQGIVLKKRHYNIANITTKLFLVSGAILGLKIVFDFIKPLLVNTFTSSITIPMSHKVAKEVKEWLAINTSGNAKRHLMLTSNAEDIDDDEEDKLITKRETSAAYGLFWFEGWPLLFERCKGSTQDPTGRNIILDKHNRPLSNDTICLKTFGFSTDRISRFLESVESDTDQYANTTKVWTLDPTKSIQYGRDILSFKCMHHPNRLLSTVDLEETTKADLIDDMEKFLGPRRAHWYSARGIPYRRGYLLHGPPGTGKTSISTALAGHFKSDLYIASINEIKDDNFLRQVFNRPSKGDVILLEDIDSAGITREAINEDSDSDDPGRKQPKGVTLSGLLNAIDSVCGIDGIVLIMTSNNPESLDQALIRPGRIDKQVYLGPVSQAVAESIFIRVYKEDEIAISPSPSSSSPSSFSPSLLRSPLFTRTPVVRISSVSHLKDLARDFALKIPEYKFTPAEIQGFLLTQSTPEQAFVGVSRWVEKVMASKNVGRNIVGAESFHLGVGVGRFSEPEGLGIRMGGSAPDGGTSSSEEETSGSDNNEEE